MALVQSNVSRIKRNRKQFKLTTTTTTGGIAATAAAASGAINLRKATNRTKSAANMRTDASIINLLKNQQQQQQQQQQQEISSDFCGLCIIQKQQNYQNNNNNNTKSYSQFYANQISSSENILRLLPDCKEPKRVEWETPTIVMTDSHKQTTMPYYTTCSLVLNAITTKAQTYFIYYTKLLLSAVEMTRNINSNRNMCSKNGQVKLVYDSIANECKKPMYSEGKTSTVSRSVKLGTRSIPTTTHKSNVCRNIHRNNVLRLSQHQSTRLLMSEHITRLFIMMIILTLSQRQLQQASCKETSIMTNWPSFQSSTMLNKIMPNHLDTLDYNKIRHMATAKPEITGTGGELVRNSVDINNYDEIIYSSKASSKDSSFSSSIKGSDISSGGISTPTVTRNLPNSNEILDQQQMDDHGNILTEVVGDITSTTSSLSSSLPMAINRHHTEFVADREYNQYERNVISYRNNDKMGTNSEMTAMANHDHMRPWDTLFEQLNSHESSYTEISGESDTDYQSTGYHKNVESINNYDEEDNNHLIAADALPKKKQFISNEDNQKLLKLVIDGLGLQNLPDMSKANISQSEYASKYREYVERVHERQRRELLETRESLRSSQVDPLLESPLQFLTITHNASMSHEYKLKREKRDVSIAGSYVDYPQRAAKTVRATSQNDKNNVLLHFPLNVDVLQLQPDDIEEANVRLMLVHSAALSHKQQNASKRPCGGAHKSKSTTGGGKQKHVINLKVYQLLEREKRVWLDGRKIEIEVDRSKWDQTYSQWLQFDVTAAVEKWLHSPQDNLGLEVQCSNCHRLGARILNDMSNVSDDNEVNEDDEEDGSVDLQLMPVLNIIGRRSGKRHKMHPHKMTGRSPSTSSGEHHHTHNTVTKTEKVGNTDCHKENQRCCRHSMEVVFKEIKGYEFILQPKVFDAGYCRGRCPPHYHTANNHAVLQSLIWQQDSAKAPRPCCAPSKLVELEILHVDEKNAEKLKISTWTDMRVVECACT